jgi:hypothetical protein
MFARARRGLAIVFVSLAAVAFVIVVPAVAIFCVLGALFSSLWRNR